MIPAQRISPNGAGFLLLRFGEYGQDKSGNWWARPPGQEAELMARESVSVHPDGTITYMRSLTGHRLIKGQWCIE